MAMATATVPPSARRVGPRSIQSFASSTADRASASRPPPAKPVTLAKRLLFPALPADADLPPLLLSPAAAQELNAELYDFLALALRAYVNTWWTKITRYDKEFLPEVTRILTVVIRAFESRLLATDLSPLVFRDLPTLLTQHWTDCRNAQAKLHTSYAAGGAASLPQLFHQMQPHMAVSAHGVIDPVYVRQVIDHILKTCLPPDDYEPETERFIVREIVLKVVVESVLPRVTQPWFIHKTILDQMGPEKVVEKVPESIDLTHDGASADRPTLQRRSSQHFSFQALAIFFLSAVQSVSGIALAILHAYKQARDTIKKVSQSKTPPPANEQVDGVHDSVDDHAFLHSRGEGSTYTPAFPGTLNVPQKEPAPPPLPSPSSSFSQPPSQTSSTPPTPEISHSPSPAHTPASSPAPVQIPNYTYPPISFVLALLTPPAPSPASPPHAPLTTSRALTHLLSLLGALAAPFLARLLPHLLYTHLLSPAALAHVLQSARRALFPDGWPAPPPVDPTPEEQAALRESLKRRLMERVPGAAAPLLGPTPAARAATVDAALAPLDDAACNAHLAIFILDLVILTIFPEMGVSEDG